MGAGGPRVVGLLFGVASLGSFTTNSEVRASLQLFLAVDKLGW